MNANKWSLIIIPPMQLGCGSNIKLKAPLIWIGI